MNDWYLSVFCLFVCLIDWLIDWYISWFWLWAESEACSWFIVGLRGNEKCKHIRPRSRIYVSCWTVLVWSAGFYILHMNHRHSPHTISPTDNFIVTWHRQRSHTINKETYPNNEYWHWHKYLANGEGRGACMGVLVLGARVRGTFVQGAFAQTLLHILYLPCFTLTCLKTKNNILCVLCKIQF